ncbi:hypothetical protein AB0E25_41605 [Streptomyces bobili]|uniref:hypothetical protein n=1 Tax=Streptomyces bobili TaxID=67280 RepID=UPI0033CE958A
MGHDLAVKVASFCRELSDGGLRQLADAEGLSATFEQARARLANGSIDQLLEADLDALDAMAAAVTGIGFYPRSVRVFRSLPGGPPSGGARIWACPRELCTGRGRVKPGQPTPICYADGNRNPLVPRLLPR